MHASDLTELAAAVAPHGRLLAHQAIPISESAMHEYWAASKSRLDCWGRAMKGFHDRIHQSTPERRTHLWVEIEPVLEEVILSEVLTRVWGSILCERDRHQIATEVGPVARSVFIGHLEARRRALRLLLFGRGVGAQPTHRINRYRRSCERWTDILLGCSVTSRLRRDFAFDPHRIPNCPVDTGSIDAIRRHSPCQFVVIAALKSTLRFDDLAHAANPALNQRVADSVLATFSPAMFDHSGLAKPLWQIQPASDLFTASVVSDLFGPIQLPTHEARNLGRFGS